MSCPRLDRIPGGPLCAPFIPFLSAKSACLNYPLRIRAVPKISDQQEIWVILTTHSPSVVAQIPLQHIKVLSRDAGIIQVINNPNQFQLNAVLGVLPTYSGIFLVEDRAAREFIKAVMSRLAPDLKQAYEVIDMGSVDEIRSMLDNFPNTGSWLKVVGLYDGDMRLTATQCRRPHTFLPGDTAPETLLRNCMRGNGQLIADKMSRNITDINM
jgi:hypothetical protein